MRSLTRAAIFITVILSAIPCALGRPVQQSKQAPATGSVSGRITVNGKPAQNVKVISRSWEGGFTNDEPKASDVTDADGRFQLTPLPDGTYRIMASAPAYYSERSGFQPDFGILVTVEKGEAVEAINISLKRGGVITGRVTDQSGHPLIRERIQLEPVDENKQRQRNNWLGGSNFWVYQTDDRGIYRLYGLPPGRYVVSAGVEKNRGMRMWNGNFYYERTYHPGVTDDSNATIVELTDGGELTGIDIVMGRAEKTYTAIGRAIDAATGKPIAHVNYGFGPLAPNGNYITSTNPGASTNSKGEFRIEGLVRGKYAVFSLQAPQSDFYAAPVSFEVKDADVTGIELKVIRGSSVSGVAVIEGANNLEIANKLSEIRVGVNASQNSGQAHIPAYNELKISADGSFRLTGIGPGNAEFFISDYPPKGFHLVRVERDGIEQRSGIQVAANEQITGVKIVIAYGTCVIRGQLKVEEGVIPEGARVGVSGHQVSGAGDTTAYDDSIYAEADAQGRFILKGLLPGEYEITSRIFRASPTGVAPVPRLKQAKQKVTVTSGAEVQVILTIEQEKDN